MIDETILAQVIDTLRPDINQTIDSLMKVSLLGAELYEQFGGEITEDTYDAFVTAILTELMATMHIWCREFRKSISE